MSINQTKISDHNEIILNVNYNIQNSKNYVKKRTEIDTNWIDNETYTGLINDTDFSHIHNFDQLNNCLNDLKIRSTKRIRYIREFNPFKP